MFCTAPAFAINKREFLSLWAKNLLMSAFDTLIYNHNRQVDKTKAESSSVQDGTMPSSKSEQPIKPPQELQLLIDFGLVH